MDLYKKGEIDELYICYTEFISPLTQTPKLMKVLPLAFDKEEAKSKENSGSRARVQYLPSPEAVLSYLIYLSYILQLDLYPQLLRYNIYFLLLFVLRMGL